MQILQSPKSEEKIEVFNISDVFGRGSPDECWIPEISKYKSILFTQDLNIHQSKQQRELYREHNLGIIFLKPPSKKGYSYWELVDKVFSSWNEIKSKTKKLRRPFAFVIRPRSKKLAEL